MLHFLSFITRTYRKITRLSHVFYVCVLRIICMYIVVHAFTLLTEVFILVR